MTRSWKIEDKKREHDYCSETRCLGDLCSNCIAGHFLFHFSGDRLQFLFAEHNPIGIADSRCLVFGWMENSKKKNKIAAPVCRLVLVVVG